MGQVLEAPPMVLPRPERLAFTDDEKRQAAEACRRYGIKPTHRLLTELWPGRCPARSTLQLWHNTVEPDPRAEQYWDIHAANHQQRLTEMFAQRLPGILDSVDRLVAKDNGTEAKNMAIAAGILYDKVVPQKSGGVALFGGTANFHINTYAPAGQLPGVAVVDTSSREV